MTALSGTQMNALTSAAQGRIDWIDHMKGVGIVLVVVGHATEGLAAHVIYLFHMPLFFVLSGFTFNVAPVADILRKRLRGLLLPYFSFLLTLVVLDNLVGAILGTEVLFDLHQPAELLARFVLGGNMLVGPLLLMVPAAIGLICLSYGGVRLLEKLSSPCAAVMSYLGQASLVIMALHFLIIVHARAFLSEGAVITLALALPLGATVLMRRSTITRKIYLGQSR